MARWRLSWGRLRALGFNLIHPATHLAFAFLCFTAGQIILGRTVDPLLALPPLFLGALLPDIDTSTSFIGRLFFSLSRWLETRLGHRQEVHTLAVAGVVGALASPLVWAGFGLSWLALVGGFISHLVLDMLQPTGIMLAWPIRARFVLFQGRVEHQSDAERLVLGLLVLFSVVIVPLAGYSPTTWLHHAFPTARFAAEDYQAWAGRYRITADITGRFRMTQADATGRYEVLDLTSTTFVLRGDAGQIYRAADQGDAEIALTRIVLQRGDPITTESREIRLLAAPLGNLLSQLPSDGDILLAGRFTADPPLPLPLSHSLAELPRCTGGSEYECRYLTPADIATLSRYRVASAAFTARITRLVGAGSSSSPTPAAAQNATDYSQVEIFINHVGDLSEVKVKPGDHVTVGQVIADLATWRQELQRDVVIAQANLALNSVRIPLPEAVSPARALITAAQAKVHLAEATYRQTTAPTAAASLQVKIAEERLSFARRWLEVLKPLQGFDPWGDLPYLVGSQSGPQGLRSDLAYREALAKAKHDLRLAELELQIAQSQADPTLARLQLEADLADLRAKIADAEKSIAEVERSQTLVDARVTQFATALEKTKAALDESYVRSLVAGEVVAVQVVQVQGNWATVKVVVASGTSAPSAGQSAIVTHVVDGDTVEVELVLPVLADKQKETVRLIGIDTPETKHPTKPVECYGREAAEFTRRLGEGQMVTVETDVELRDRYGRLLAYLWLADGRMVNEVLVSEGYARTLAIPPNVRHAARFAALEQEARAGRRGLWSACR